jgi:hypothetical protein
MPTGAANSFASDAIMPQLIALIGATPIQHVTIGGYGDMWSPAYLALSKFDAAGNSNYTPVALAGLTHGMSDTAIAIIGMLGFNDYDNLVYQNAA